MLPFPSLTPILVVLFTAGACASQLSRPHEELAILDWSGWGAPRVFGIDGKATAGQDQAKLPPGKHTIRYGGSFATSVLLNPKGSAEYDLGATIDMKAGHVYAPKSERVYGYGTYRDYLWIEDTTTGEVVAGQLPPAEREKTKRSGRARVKREVEEHFEALSAAAGCGDAHAEYDLGLYYLAGIDPVGHRDLVQAYVWYSVAASRGHQDAAGVRDRVRKDLRPEQLDLAERLIASARSRECPMERTSPLERAKPEPKASE